MCGRRIGCAAVVLWMLWQAEGHAGSLLEGLIDRAADSAKQKAENRMNQRMDQAIDKAINKTEETVQGVATDRECLVRAQEQGKRSSWWNPPSLAIS